MRRGKNLMGPSEFIGEMPREQIVDSANVDTRCTCDAGSELFPRSYMSRKTTAKDEEVRDDPTETDRFQEPTVAQQSVSRKALKSKVPSLRKTKITLHGRISELFSGKLTTKSPAVSETPETLQLDTVETVDATTDIREEKVISESASQQIAAEPKPAAIPITETVIIPTPVKRRRIPKEELAAEPAKPLKIIRRRREEEPKVFETSRHGVPKSMLEGTTIGLDEELEPAR
ncbi:hypothetical protein [Desulfomonile tiedjei]|uniref:Uncharacterized protein n=1 Tax=Desulfomonile tiedjei (strain ATCC 49306 / DSM 6799 / DCB-1) TaxID=706587 RepID=I4C6P6_DESTA|nr:hypothetical protein [Desulfomonile tiedjei]AFM25237.1 hypothetical protein Desti_2557 [Desulfomonile tiedjei DSM 6799]